MNFPRSCVIFSACILLFSELFTSCASTSSGKKTDSLSENTVPASQIKLIFAGDIMAHTINFKAGNFPRIWEDITPLVSSGDLSFANIEAPVNDKKDWSTYPQFNMHSSYVQAAIDAGFNVFSLSNNHTNDWGLEGINATRNFFAARKELWACGLKSKKNDPLTYKVITKNDWKILFVSITEILNRPDASGWIDYFPAKKHDDFIKQLKEISASNQHDLLIISIHTDEEEYKTKVTESHKSFYRQLVTECGADIIWANHPHCSKEFELISTEEKKAFIMYANGNTISAQRTSPSFNKTPSERDDTGDGLIIKITMEKDIKPEFKSIEPYFITTYIQPDAQFTVKLVDDDFIHCLKRTGHYGWAGYLENRRSIYNNLKGKSKWQ